jgi:hypothetical protein
MGFIEPLSAVAAETDDAGRETDRPKYSGPAVRRPDLTV